MSARKHSSGIRLPYNMREISCEWDVAFERYCKMKKVEIVTVCESKV